MQLSFELDHKLPSINIIGDLVRSESECFNCDEIFCFPLGMRVVDLK